MVNFKFRKKYFAFGKFYILLFYYIDMNYKVSNLMTGYILLVKEL